MTIPQSVRDTWQANKKVIWTVLVIVGAICIYHLYNWYQNKYGTSTKETTTVVSKETEKKSESAETNETNKTVETPDDDTKSSESKILSTDDDTKGKWIVSETRYEDDEKIVIEKTATRSYTECKECE